MFCEQSPHNQKYSVPLDPIDDRNAPPELAISIR